MSLFNPRLTHVPISRRLYHLSTIIMLKIYQTSLPTSIFYSFKSRKPTNMISGKADGSISYVAN